MPTPAQSSVRHGPKDLYSLPPDPVVIRQAGVRAQWSFILQMLVVLWFTTELLAWRFHFDPALGKPELLGIYSPWMCLGWFVKFGFAHYRNHAFAQYVYGTLLLGVAVCFIGLIGALIVASRTRRRYIHSAPRAPDVKGSAHWASPQDLRDLGLLKD